ncbi:MAG: 4-(cytidine 5'-diphospho)-2-C-methyl-D-erythritol kinase [Phycisphaerales bacterium]
MPPPGTSLTLSAPGKVNLALAVGPPDERGFHPIASWVVPIDLCDDLHIERLPEGTPSRFSIIWAEDAPRETPIDWPTEKDLAVKAHALLEQHAGKPLPTALTLRKRIPVGGGLGGGSADCALMLRALNDLFELGHPEKKLHGFASRLGSDVAFFIDAQRPITEAPRAALMTGLGQGITRIPPVSAVLMLLIPSFGTPTGPVFQKYDQLNPSPLKRAEVENLILSSAAAGRIDPARLFNDLTAPAERIEPRLAGVRAMASATLEMPVHLTGSGSTMFVVAPGAKEARSLGATIKKAKLGLTPVTVRVG